MLLVRLVLLLAPALALADSVSDEEGDCVNGCVEKAFLSMDGECGPPPAWSACVCNSHKYHTTYVECFWSTCPWMAQSWIDGDDVACGRPTSSMNVTAAALSTLYYATHSTTSSIFTVPPTSTSSSNPTGTGAASRVGAPLGYGLALALVVL